MKTGNILAFNSNFKNQPKQFKNISFGNYVKNSIKDDFFVESEYNDDNVLLKELFFNDDKNRKIRRNIEYDTNIGKALKVENFDINARLLDIQEFEYSEGKVVEKFNSQAIQYIRTITNNIQDSIQYFMEKYESTSAPSNNYINEITRDLNGKMLTFLCNGKKVL